ncbi:D-3-phosphoglycerate dehydrogenase [Methanococcus maripaludis KA1]|uniref:D-3-phosphoglycerate dehydrogenase n=3 Tax=Methanococcus maripaludis TaxID=39152 RepID=A0A7J9RZB9_METMI|nr:phosphoglycerate dehydrogenase [Methanococcus maripaludis]AEK20612.1 D-3-phosphoglycerate dehydrogenase [Methanococcus maripaludis X1]MBB6067343.1 D-3-phosphoglycerate dehydrogenase [Methanococcus maripaludis]BAP61935.1 D-3-phosphoglycerate dehydrogenase [Methanococcus maripaludis KA1]
MSKILITDPLHESAVEILKQAGEVEVATGLTVEELKLKIKDVDALVIRSGTTATREIIEASENLKVIARAGVGVDNVDLDAATEKGIVVVNAPDASSISVAELLFGMMLSAARNIPQATASIKSGKWDRKSFKGMEIYGKTLGIVGLGRIGQQVAKRAQAFGMTIVAYDPYIPEDVASELGIKLLTVDELCTVSDFITLHVPLTPKTKHMIGKEQIALMKSNMVIMNCARGGLIDETALYDALNSGKIKAAALDVFEQEPPKESPLLTLNNLIGTPHQGASTEEAQLSAGTIVAEQTVKILKGESAENVVNLPMVPTEKMKKLKPYMVLAEKMGSMAIQYLDNSIELLEITYMGGLAKEKTEILKRSFLKGILAPILLAGVNLVNAPVIAKSRNIKIAEGTMSESDYGNSIKISAKGENDEISIIGSIEHNEVVFREINGYRMDIKPEGTICIIKHIDRPGMVGKVGVLLGEHGINIAGMQVGRREPGGHSIMFLDIDHMISDEVLDEIRKMENVRAAKSINI